MFKAATLATTMLLAAAGIASAASFDGKTVRVQQVFEGAIFNPLNVLVGPGVEYTSGYDLDIFGTFFTVSFDVSTGLTQTALGNGPSIFDIFESLPDIIGVSLVSYDFANAPTVTFNANEIFTDFGAAGLAVGKSATFEVFFAPVADVPVPAALPLMLGALGGLAMLHRRRA